MEQPCIGSFLPTRAICDPDDDHEVADQFKTGAKERFKDRQEAMRYVFERRHSLLAYIQKKLNQMGPFASGLEAEDILGDVLLMVCQQIETLRDLDQFVPFVYQKTRDHLRRMRVRLHREVLLESPELQMDTSQNPARLALMRLKVNQLRKTYQDPSDQRNWQMLILRYVEGYTFQEIAERYHMKTSTTKSAVRLFLLRLRVELNLARLA